MANQVTLTFAGDSQSLERTFTRVGEGAREMAADFDTAAADARDFSTAMDAAGGAADTSEGAFMGAADILDGLGGAFGLPTEGATGLMRAYGDLTGGFAQIGPMFGQAIGWLSNLSIVQKASAAAQWLLNAAMSANPIGLVVLAIAALVGGFVLAWQHSETFRDVVRGAMDGVKVAVGWVVDRFTDLWGWISRLGGEIGGALSGVGESFLSPFRWAFDKIKGLWNSTVGGFRFEVPDWIPGVGGKGFTIPRMHLGGTVPGNPGEVVPILALAGETVSRVGSGAGSGTGPTVIVNVPGLVGSDDQLARKIHSLLLRHQNRVGNLGFEVA